MHEPDPLQELAELAADLRALLEYAQLQGVSSLPRGEVDASALIDAEPLEASRPSTRGGSRRGASSRRSGSSAPSSPGRGAAARPVSAPPRGRAATPPRPQLNPSDRAAPPDVGAPQAPGPTAPTPRAPSPQRQESLGAWASSMNRRDPADALRQIRDDLGDCRRCGLCEGRSQIVFGEGDARADLVIVGDAPGELEDRSGRPFQGPAGEMLSRMLTHVLELDRTQIYALDLVKCRPPGDRAPTPAEVAACRPFFGAQLRALKPRIVLAMGDIACKAVAGVPLDRARGHWQHTPARLPVMPTWHPRHLLQNPSDKRGTFEDLKSVRARYDKGGGRRR